MNPDLITLVLLIVFLLCALGVVYLGAWVLRKGPKPPGSRNGCSASSPPRRAPGTAAPRTFLILSDKEVGKLRAWLNRALGVFSSEKLQLNCPAPTGR
jgi:hypothetical protein